MMSMKAKINFAESSNWAASDYWSENHAEDEMWSNWKKIVDSSLFKDDEIFSCLSDRHNSDNFT